MKNIAIAVILLGSLLVTGCATIKSKQSTVKAAESCPKAVIEVRNG